MVGATQQLEMAVCGKPEINIDTLKSMTAMSVANHEKLGQWFWAVLEGFKNEERADFLAFACGRSRLPTRPTGALAFRSKGEKVLGFGPQKQSQRSRKIGY